MIRVYFLVLLLVLILRVSEINGKPHAVVSSHQFGLVDGILTFMAKMEKPDRSLYTVYWSEMSWFDHREPRVMTGNLTENNNFESEWTLNFPRREYSAGNYSVRASIVLPLEPNEYIRNTFTVEFLSFTLANELPVTGGNPESCYQTNEYVPIDCHTYFSCVDFKFKKYFTCSREHGLAFNPKTKVCDRMKNVEGCNVPPVCHSEYRPHPENCNKYYYCPDVCKKELCRMRSCPDDLLWSGDADGNGHQQCTLPEFAKCLSS